MSALWVIVLLLILFALLGGIWISKFLLLLLIAALILAIASWI